MFCLQYCKNKFKFAQIKIIKVKYKKYELRKLMTYIGLLLNLPRN